LNCRWEPPCSAGAVLNNLKPIPDSSIAICGYGAVGMSAILAAAYLGVKTIIAFDIVPQRLTLAKEFGATHVISGKSITCTQDVRDITPHGTGTTLARSSNSSSCLIEEKDRKVQQRRICNRLGKVVVNRRDGL
jgi:Zn-dependent alcohol dehydrogenase